MVVRMKQWRAGWLAVLTLFLGYCRIVLSINCNVTINITAENHTGVFSSPSFPNSYTKLREDYTCWFWLVPDTPSKYIQLTFDDFHLSSHYPHPDICDSGELDYLAIHAGSVVSKHCGCRRPEMVLQDGDGIRLELRVQPERIDESAFRGFRARYQYMQLDLAQLKSLQNIHLYSTKRDISSGEGTVSNTVAPLPASVSSIIIDGLYYIEAGPHTRIWLSAFIENATPDTGTVEVRDGHTSADPLLYDGTLEMSQILVSSQSAVYIRWRGVIPVEDITIKLTMDFTAFKQPSGQPLQCESGYFLCENQRCINSLLTCNSRDNCGDGSDELQGHPTDVCHANVCSPNPCLNGGTCTSGISLCQCRFGYFGTFCQLVNNDCQSSPCLNGGTCQPYSNGPGFVCFCKTNRRGPYCQENVGDSCKMGQCNEGTCVQGKCDCPDNHYGDFCHLRANSTSTTDYTDLQHTSIMIGAFVGAVCLLSICWLIAMARKRQTDEPVGRIARIVSVHSRDERSMRPSVTGGNIDLPPDYSDCVFDDTDGSPLSKRVRRPAVITEENEEPDGEVFEADGEEVEGGEVREIGPLSPPPTYESVAQSEDDGIVFEVQPLSDVATSERSPVATRTDTIV